MSVKSPGKKSASFHRDAAVRSAALLWAIAFFSAGIGATFEFGLVGGHDPEIGAGALIFLCLGLIVIAGWQLASVASDASLSAAESGRSAFFEHAIEGIFRTSVNGRYLDANPALARIYGYPNASTLMDELTDISAQLYVDPGRRKVFQVLLRSDDAVVDFVSEIRRRDGTKIWISENARAVRNWTGRIIFYEGTVEDVTAKIVAQDSMRRALKQTEEASRAKTAFLAAMSHELKTPLNAVLGFSEILQTELLGPLGHPAYREYAADIHGSGQRLLGIIDDVLDAARAQAGTIELDRRATRLADIAQDALALARAATNDVRAIVVDLPPSLPPVSVDQRRLCQALAKLLSNAFKFTPKVGAIRLSAGMTQTGGVEIIVVDEGIGMERDMIALALEPFGQVDRSLSRRFEGTGLGLPIARAFVELHGGELSLESEKGRGTAVKICLPPTCVVSDSTNFSPECAAAG